VHSHLSKKALLLPGNRQQQLRDITMQPPQNTPKRIVTDGGRVVVVVMFVPFSHLSGEQLPPDNLFAGRIDVKQALFNS